jgi:hypothetical protein
MASKSPVNVLSVTCSTLSLRGGAGCACAGTDTTNAMATAVRQRTSMVVSGGFSKA